MSGILQFLGRPVFEALTPAEVRAAGSSVQLWRLTADFTVLTPSHGEITVPAGFVSDFASVPAAVPRWIIDDDSPTILYGCVVHDYLYTCQTLPRQVADEILRECMLACGANSLLAALVYRAVRLGGAGHWAA